MSDTSEDDNEISFTVKVNTHFRVILKVESKDRTALVCKCHDLYVNNISDTC